MLLFDAQGHLTPYDLIETDWQTFIETFGWNEHRQTLVATLRSFLDTLRLTDSVDVWIDGSFVTYKERPNDIDVVLFLPAREYQVHERRLRGLREQSDQLDLYIVRQTDTGERDHFLYLADRAEWLFQFTMSRPDRLTRRKFPKGFLQIAWTYEPTV